MSNNETNLIIKVKTKPEKIYYREREILRRGDWSFWENSSNEVIIYLRSIETNRVPKEMFDEFIKEHNI